MTVSDLNMFSSFLRSRLPNVSIFHRPSSQPSTKALSLLRSSLSSPYPSDKPNSLPLEFNLEVVESPPTVDQLRTILSYFPSKAVSPGHVFLSAHPSAPSLENRPTTLSGIVELARDNPQAIKWPIVVNWEDGKVAVGDVEGVKGILEHLRKKRDGETKDDEVEQPKGCAVMGKQMMKRGNDPPSCLAWYVDFGPWVQMPESKGKNAVIIAPSTTRRAYPLHLPHFPPPQSDGVALETYPMTSPSDKPYDEQLLVHAPEVTKADLQDGYNPDILVPQRPSASRVLSQDSDSDRHDVESAGGASQPKEKIYSEKPKSFWKTRKGIIVLTSIIILIAVILGAVLGGVLGSRKGGGDQPTPTSPDGQGSVGQDQGTMPLPSNGNDSNAQNGPAT